VANEKANRFKWDGRDLAYWLWEFVGDDIDRRDVATAALNGMQDPGSSGLNFVLARESFGEAVRATLAKPQFAAAAFIRKLVRLMRQAQTLRMRLWHDENARVDRVMDKLAPRLEEPGLSEERMRTLHKRMGRVICSDGESHRLQGQLLNQSVTGLMLFGELGEHVLKVPDVVREMLKDPQEEHAASDVIRKLGPAAAVFADHLIGVLDAWDHTYGFQPAAALASVIRDDARRVREIVRRLDADRPIVACGAAWVLQEIGPRAAELAPECVWRLLALTNAEGQVGLAAVGALGRVARENDVAVKRVLEISRSHDVWARGIALTALADMVHRPEWVVPRLVEAFTDYEEPNPDWTYRSRHERVVYALKAFGPAAAPAVPALIERVRSDEGMDRGAVEALGAIGPAAAAALPVLEAMVEPGDEEIPEEMNPLAVAIRRIRGGQA
jgi:hypothetical protein